jgi:hypothetical protein
MDMGSWRVYAKVIDRNVVLGCAGLSAFLMPYWDWFFAAATAVFRLLLFDCYCLLLLLCVSFCFVGFSLLFYYSW